MAHRNDPFVHIKGDLTTGVTGDNIGIRFDSSWAGLTATPPAKGVTSEAADDMPSRLLVPEYVKVFKLLDDQGDATGRSDSDIYPEHEVSSLQDLGRAARVVVNSCFGPLATECADGVLFRNLHHRIKTPEDFAVFWEACLEGKDGWAPAAYCSFAKERSKLGGVDLVTNFPPEQVLNCHNEMAYNPHPPGRIAFFCMQDAAEGGETILVRNADLSLTLSSEIQDLVKQHGGIMYRRTYHDRNNNVEVSGPQVSWQDKCGTEERDEAVRFFTDIGIAAEDVYFNDEGALIAQNIHSGFNNDGNWFNILYMGVFKLADGTSIPPELLLKLKSDKWKPARALKLRPGDWLVLNNLTVQHGRLPFKNTPDQQRTILTVYTSEVASRDLATA
jgi:hypothetical protein